MKYKGCAAVLAALMMMAPSAAFAEEEIEAGGDMEEKKQLINDSASDEWFFSPSQEEAYIAKQKSKQRRLKRDADTEEEDASLPDDSNADDWFYNPSDDEAYQKEKKEKEQTEEKEKKKKARERFVEICRDDSFIYKLDRSVSRYKTLPGSVERERIFDVWVKLEPIEMTEEEYAYPAKYYLEHYLLRPKTQQVQFLCELEVTGRPSNDVQDQKYNSQRWENLVPGSIEDTIYHAVMKNKSKIRDDSVKDGTSIRDYLDRTFHIAL